MLTLDTTKSSFSAHPLHLTSWSLVIQNSRSSSFPSYADSFCWSSMISCVCSWMVFSSFLFCSKCVGLHDTSGGHVGLVLMEGECLRRRWGIYPSGRVQASGPQATKSQPSVPSEIGRMDMQHTNTAMPSARMPMINTLKLSMCLCFFETSVGFLAFGRVF